MQTQWPEKNAHALTYPVEGPGAQSTAGIGEPSLQGIGKPPPAPAVAAVPSVFPSMPAMDETPPAGAAQGCACPAFSLSRSARTVLPTTLQSAADGKTYRIDPCFRTVLACIKRMCDPDADDLQKLLYLARRFFLAHPPADLDRLFAAFVTGGQSGESEPPLLDFELDAGAIYASFLQQYGIDLLSAELHWLAFRELLAGLTENTPLGVRIRLRALPDERVAPEDRALVRRLKEKIAIVPKTGKAEQALLDELNRRLATGENPADVLEKLREV